MGTDVAMTLCARDYKGYGTGWDSMNGVFKKKRQISLLGEHTGGADSTRLCGECLPEERTSTDPAFKGLQRTDIDIRKDRALMLGILDPEGYDKENRVYSGGGLCPTLLVGNGRIKVVTK